MSAPPSPVDLLELRPVVLALIELGLLALAGGLLGAWVVLRRLAFFTHAVGTATFPGLVVAEAAAFSPRLAALGVALGFAGGVERAGRRGRDPGSVATALGLVAALAGGVVLASGVFESGAGVDRLLFGTALGLDVGDLAFSGASCLLALGACLVFGRTWTATGFDPDGVESLGVSASRADLWLLAALAVAVVGALPAVGALLVSSIFVVPAAIARLYARSVGALVRASVLVAAGQGALGLYLAFWFDVPPGPAVSVLGAALYAGCALARARRPRAISFQAAGAAA